MARIIFVHSIQPSNRCKAGDSERDHMTRIMTRAAEMVREHGHEVLVGPFGDYNANGKANFDDNVDFINDQHRSKPVDAVVSGHSNANGGSLVAWYPGNAFGKKLALAIKARLGRITPDRVGERDNLLVSEIADTKPTVVLTESYRHDTTKGARWIHENVESIARAHADGVLDVFGRISEPLKPTTPARPPVPATALSATVRLLKLTSPAMRGEDVKQLQREALRVFPTYARPALGKWGADGIFGKGTDSFVREFQRRTSLGVDGKVGPATRAAMAKFGMKGF